MHLRRKPQSGAVQANARRPQPHYDRPTLQDEFCISSTSRSASRSPCAFCARRAEHSAANEQALRHQPLKPGPFMWLLAPFCTDSRAAAAAWLQQHGSSGAPCSGAAPRPAPPRAALRPAPLTCRCSLVSALVLKEFMRMKRTLEPGAGEAGGFRKRFSQGASCSGIQSLAWAAGLTAQGQKGVLVLSARASSPCVTNEFPAFSLAALHHSPTLPHRAAPACA